ncbi:MAG: DUF2924 domain-containing protein [Pseudomonadota bacterium]
MLRSNSTQPRRKRSTNRQSDEDTLRSRIHALPNCPREELEAEWRRLWKSDVPRRASRIFLVRAIAYGLQVEVYGGLDAQTRRLLKKASEVNRKSAGKPSTKLSQGTKLFREWHGETHEVLVLDKGFAWHGETYRSLSAIARVITGTRWNGPAFFGLKRSRKQLEPNA